MRIYLPATAADLVADPIPARNAHAATPSLAAALPDEDEEGLEVSASLCAADASVLLLSDPGASGLADRRVVIASDIDDGSAHELTPSDDVLPGTVALGAGVSWDDVAAILIDDPLAEADVRAARTGDEEAFERAAEADLLWYDVSERPALALELRV